jgi:hypothetical protein
MTMTDTRPATPLTDGTPIYVNWGPVIAGAIAAAALSFVLHAFAAAIGMAVSSTAPTWRDASIALVLLSGLYLILVALAAFSLGGYIAGRMRTRMAPATPDEVEFRDGAHGLLVWALAIVLTALLAFAAAQSATRLAAPSGGHSGPAASVGGENIIAYDLDKLFRAERRPPETDMTYTRAEAARILLTSSSHDGVTADDRAYLTRLVAARTGLSAGDAQTRVNTAIESAKTNINRARRSGVILAFMAGAAALLGAAAAWFAACAGGRHRDGAVAAPSMMWGRPMTGTRI